MIAALYTDPRRSPYLSIPGVECWGPDRNADLYPGPWAVVAHPPCGHWGRYSHKCRDQGLNMVWAVTHVRRWGGVLEQPKDSRAFRAFGLPHPGEPMDRFGGWTIQVRQRDWGHDADKLTWLYLVGITHDRLPPMPPPGPPVPPPPPGRRHPGRPGENGRNPPPSDPAGVRPMAGGAGETLQYDPMTKAPGRHLPGASSSTVRTVSWSSVQGRTGSGIGPSRTK